MTIKISTHAPRTGSDRPTSSGQGKPARFQPTLPARGATDWRGRHRRCGAFQPTLPARGATRRTSFSALRALISTHAPRTGSDLQQRRDALRRAISTHAPRTGSDAMYDADFYLVEDFNPRSPHGERHFEETLNSLRATFQPTLPARGATSDDDRCTVAAEFQPTLPARGATLCRLSCLLKLVNFNPRSPHGERRAGQRRYSQGADFNPRSPHGERPTRAPPM